MSAIDTTFRWVLNPTAINGLATTYVSKRGSDVSGDGTANNPYASIGKATSVAFNGTNIMLGDGDWNGARTVNNRAFNWWGNGKTKFSNGFQGFYNGEKCYNIFISNILNAFGNQSSTNVIFFNCFLYEYTFSTYSLHATYYNCIIIGGGKGYRYSQRDTYYNCVLALHSFSEEQNNAILYNCILIQCKYEIYSAYNCNFTDKNISTKAINSINNQITSQNLQDYFNHLPQSIIDNPLNAPMEDWLKCDFTAKKGSANIGAGEKGTTIGLNQGYTMYADNSSNDVFKANNGAVLKNVAWNENLQGYTIVQKEKVSPLGGTFGSHTITLDSSASSENGYYVGLFIGIVGGKGYGQTRLITNYNGASRLCGVDRDWDVIPDSNSVYTISGTITSAVKDLGKAIKVKRNWTFMDMTALSDGQWSQFLTHKTEDGEMFPTSSYQWEYSMDGNFWYQGSTADDLVSATDGENKVYDNTYGDCSADFDEENAKPVTMRYIRVSVHIGFNIGE